MSGLHTARPAPSTTERLHAAWWEAESLARRALVAAVISSVVLGMMVPAGRAVRLSVVVVGGVLALAALVDAHEHRLPNRLLALAAVASLAGAAGTGGDASRGWAVGGVVALAALVAVRLTRGIGMGDVKAGAVVGASTGAVALVAAPVAIAVAATAAAFVGISTGRRRLALGPSLWTGWAVALLGTSWGWWS